MPSVSFNIRSSPHKNQKKQQIRNIYLYIYIISDVWILVTRICYVDGTWRESDEFTGQG